MIAHLALAAAGLVGVVALMEATQNRPDDPPPGSTSTVAFTVSTRDFPGGNSTAANTLAAVCAATVDSVVSAPAASGDEWLVRITPALGEHGRKRLEGCLEDVTLDRVIGHVTDVHTTG
ncbi:MAG TPA: hypothetical protein VFV63_20720 [Ilumatobacteraceae bacterium]|nr:hypothetical protein [Ilumatobacteraceae bacterium]